MKQPLSVLKTDALSYSLLHAAKVVSLVRDGTALPLALAKIIKTDSVPASAQGAIADISYRTIRQLGRSQVLLAMLATKHPDPPLLNSLLCVALGLMCAAEKADDAMPYTAFTVVDQAVLAASSHASIVHAKGMVNAVLRRFLRERDALMQTALKDEVALWNYPKWWIDTVRQSYPQQWESILSVGNSMPPLTLRVNRRKTTLEAYLALLAANAIAATQVGDNAVRLQHPVPVQMIPGFMDGLVSVQDAGAQLAAPLLDVQNNMHVLDVCAAPGGKTGHLLECADIDLLAIEVDASRALKIEENLQRLQLSARIVCGDATKANWWDGQLFDRILVDVPCTASGIVRRHPDIRWLRRKSDAAKLAVLARDILDNVWPMLKPGGKLLLVTCSIWPMESTAQADAFATRHGARCLSAPLQLLPTEGELDDHDGLFYALFQK